MAEFWTDPDETTAEADGLQRPIDGFDPPPTEGYDEVEGGISDEMQALVDRNNEVVDIIAAEITNDPPATF